MTNNPNFNPSTNHNHPRDNQDRQQPANSHGQPPSDAPNQQQAGAAAHHNLLFGMLNSEQQEQLHMSQQQRLNRYNSRLQRSGILLQNLAEQVDRSNPQETNGS